MNLSQSIGYVLWSAMWMSWNIMLALIPIILAFVISKSKNTILNAIALLVWLIFLPNTLYMVTDGMYVYSEGFGNMNSIGMAFGVVLYAGIIALAPYTYYWSLKPILNKYKKIIKHKTRLFVFINSLVFSFLMALGITMGRFARTNSWYILTQPLRVMRDLVKTLTNFETILFLAAFFVGVSLFNYIILKPYINNKK